VKVAGFFLLLQPIYNNLYLDSLEFADFNLNKKVFEGVDAMGFTEPSEVQEKVIPLALQKRDLIACAQTGTGKTAAYLLPLCHHLCEKKEHKIKGLILAPTRELVLQIDQQFQGFAYFCGLESVAIYGGNDAAIWEQQRVAIERGASILVASPGRLLSHLNLGYVDLSSLEYLILDEADKMLDMGFLDDLNKIISYLPKTDRQTMLFSATMPSKIRVLANAILHDPEEINIAISKPAEGVIQAAYVVYDEQKNKLIEILLKEKELDSVIIFSSTKSKVKSLVNDLRKAKLNANAIHSDLEQTERESVMLDFRNRKFPILVATDIVSRGIDIDNIGLIINYDAPHDPEDYIHRVGRTARASATGVALTFVNPTDMHRFARIEKLIETNIFKIPVPAELGPGPEYNPNARMGKSGKGHFHRKPGKKGNHRPKGNGPHRSRKKENQ
jgi:ATP-dependent RNA helicase RhlE